MNLPKLQVPRPRVLLLAGAALLLALALYGAQRGGVSQQVAQIGPLAPMPVYVVNEATVPDDFTPGSTWQFTTWTIPNAFSWTATVERVSGGWAFLNVTQNGQTVSGWYYIPNMQGFWRRQ